MKDWSKLTDEQVFGDASESSGSDMAYWRDTEIKRRLFVLQRKALNAQLASTAAQGEAIVAQREAVTEMRRQYTVLFWSVIGIFVTAIVTVRRQHPWHRFEVVI